MKKYKLSIELLSDLCVADGGVYNSSINTDVCQDEFGLPYIPAKRIKGCLRECAQELADWGDDVSPAKLFGGKGDKENAGKVRIADAYLRNYAELVKEIQGGNRVIYHPQNVLKNYTYIRTQTSIDKDNGTAKENSLRTMRVINKGLIFESELLLYDEKLYEGLLKCSMLLRNIGLARTRGLGEIKVSLEEISVKSDIEKKDYNGEGTIKYSIKLLEPMICKSINGGESNSYDYIEGSKVIGLLARQLNDNNKLLSILDDNQLVFSNAYIEKKGNRMVEVPAYYYTIKNNKSNYINRLVYDDAKNESEKRQINGFKHCYVSINNEKMEKTSVDMEERYHHSRPVDKSIGRATDDPDSKFYQISSINKGQTFSGFISGSPENIKTIYDIMADISVCYMGYGSSSEYGKCEFSVCPTPDEHIEKKSGREFVVSLVSPAIVYNEHAMYSTDHIDFLKEVLLAGGLKEEDICKLDMDKTKRFMKYTNLGGYNVTWNARKPVISAFDKGTGVKLVFSENVEMKTGKRIFIGERNQEGYGECSISELNTSENEENWIYGDVDRKIDSANGNDVGGLGKNICKRLFSEHILFTASNIIKKGSLRSLVSEKSRATVSNMSLMCSEMNSMDEIYTAVEARFGKTSHEKRDKKEIAKKILKGVEDSFLEVDEFCDRMNISKDDLALTDDAIKMSLLKGILIEMKYQIRANKGGNIDE